MLAASQYDSAYLFQNKLCYLILYSVDILIRSSYFQVLQNAFPLMSATYLLILRTLVIIHYSLKTKCLMLPLILCIVGTSVRSLFVCKSIRQFIELEGQYFSKHAWKSNHKCIYSAINAINYQLITVFLINVLLFKDNYCYYYHTTTAEVHDSSTEIMES